MWPNPQFPADLVAFTGEILNGKLHSLCSLKGTQVIESAKSIKPILPGMFHMR